MPLQNDRKANGPHAYGVMLPISLPLRLYPPCFNGDQDILSAIGLSLLALS